MRLLLISALALGGPLCAQVKIAQQADRITVEVNGKPFTALLISGPETTKPYFHPLRTATGKIVNRHWPMENVPGERHDEKHQRGLWFSHGDVNGDDFWDNEASYTTPNRGFILLDRVHKIKSGDKSGEIDASFRWVDHNKKALLADTRKMIFYADPALRTIDFMVTLKALETVKFGDSKEGTFGIRLAPGFHRIVNSDGQEGEKNCWGKRANWVDYSGEIEGEPVGVAILDNPSNPRHPTYWHVRAYGLFAANIFGIKAFEKNPSLDGSMTLQPGETLTFRYRVILHAGDEKTANIAAEWAKYVASK